MIEGNFRVKIFVFPKFYVLTKKKKGREKIYIGERESTICHLGYAQKDGANGNFEVGNPCC